MAFSERTATAQGKPELYEHICHELGKVFARESNLIANAANAAAVLYHLVPDVNWVGFYLAEGDELVLGPFQGQPAITRIPLGKGVCGAAALERKTIVVSDISKFPGHIACDSSSKSELVVPLLNWGHLLGVLDVDSASPARFDEDDREGFESVAAVFVASIATNDLPDLSDSAAMD